MRRCRFQPGRARIADIPTLASCHHRSTKKSKGTAAKRSCQAHLRMKNHHGLVANAQVTQATDTAERESAIDTVEMLGDSHRVTLGPDKSYATRVCVDRLRCANANPPVAQHIRNCAPVIDGSPNRQPGYAASQDFLNRIEECFGWAKTFGDLRKSQFVERESRDLPDVLPPSFRLSRASEIHSALEKGCRLRPVRGAAVVSRPISTTFLEARHGQGMLIGHFLERE